MFDSSMVNELSGFEPLKFYCNVHSETYSIQIPPEESIAAKGLTIYPAVLFLFILFVCFNLVEWADER